MKLIVLFTIILITIGCGATPSPEQIARESYEFNQRYLDEYNRLERKGLPSKEEERKSKFGVIMLIIMFFILGLAIGGILKDKEKPLINKDSFNPFLDE